MVASKLTDQVSGAIKMQQTLYVHSFLPHKVAIQGTLHVVSIECCSFITAVNKGQPVYRSPLPSVKIGRGGRGGSVHRLLRARRLGISPKCYEQNP